MIVVSEVRCSDCLSEFGADGARFAVIKEDKSQHYTAEERQLSAHLYEVFVCGDCAGWYDQAAPVNDAAEEKARAWR